MASLSWWGILSGVSSSVFLDQENQPGFVTAEHPPEHHPLREEQGGREARAEEFR